MRNAFLLLTFIVIVLLIKNGTASAKLKLQRLEIKKSHVIETTGTLFVPLTLQVDKNLVKDNYIILSIVGKKYLYQTCLSNFCLVGDEAKEVPVAIGDKIVTSFPVRLFLQRDL